MNRNLPATSREALIALNMMEGIGPVTVLKMINILGPPQDLFYISEDELMNRCGGVIPRSILLKFISQRHTVNWKEELIKAEEKSVNILTWDDPGYPSQLKSIYDPPVVLYFKGDPEILKKQTVAIVGTRHPTLYGKKVAEDLAFDVASSGIVVVSGLAEGIDTYAHKGALKAKEGKTVAVIGGGFNHVYPLSNRTMAEEIANRGIVISEFPFDRKPDRTTFPIRNRIISGLSRAVVVVEAGIKSGAMITASVAIEQGKTVMAVPGRIDSYASFGTNELIANGAKVVRNSKDILEEFNLLPLSTDRTVEFQVKLSSKEVVVVDAIKQGNNDVDSLINVTGFSAAEINSILLSLEIKHIVKMLPGRCVELEGEYNVREKAG